MSTIVDKVILHKELAEKISNALNALNDEAKTAVKMEMQNYEVALDKLAGRRNQIFDLFVDKTITEDEYRRQSARLEDERRHYTKLLEQSQLSISDAWRISAQKIFELAINAKIIWNSGNAQERLEYLREVCSNQNLDGATLQFTLRKPFLTLSEMREKENWRALILRLRTEILEYAA